MCVLLMKTMTPQIVFGLIKVMFDKIEAGTTTAKVSGASGIRPNVLLCWLCISNRKACLINAYNRNRFLTSCVAYQRIE